ncbi:hypothetical protein AS9A_3732 [Hoyosella subflava DQS3-9A1]|uniref:Uncharacterized protein n=1 Tax=Hoyosella subflava (strain DSM 45089 / JCM 17490 / NBRC 109087 / DQS3-9A1) TaxID=443218 RepID=F6EF33_HOYSD|nr:hypothetical protein AS9A_3732 [Hoyosella subflava DQS3-9A1]
MSHLAVCETPDVAQLDAYRAALLCALSRYGIGKYQTESGGDMPEFDRASARQIPQAMEPTTFRCHS